MAIMYGRYVRNITKKVQDSLASATQVAEERISNIRTVRAFSQEGLENKIYQGRISEVLGLAYKEALARATFFGMASFTSIADVISNSRNIFSYHSFVVFLWF